MVCGLVQQHQIRRFSHQLGQSRTAALSARCGFDQALGVKFQPFRRTLYAVKFPGLQRAGGKITQSGMAGHGRILLHITSRQTRRDHPRAAVWFNQAGHHFHQGGFSGPVAAHQGQPVAGLHNQIKPVKNRITAKCQRNIAKL